MDEWGENFCYNICYARKEYGLTQAEMAGILGISVRKLRRIERMDPTVRIGMRMIVCFCNYFEVSGDAVLRMRLDEKAFPRGEGCTAKAVTDEGWRALEVWNRPETE